MWNASHLAVRLCALRQWKRVSMPPTTNQRDGSFGMPLAYTNQKNRPFGLLSHSAGMHNTDISIAGICPNKFERAKGSKRFHFASLHYIFSAYLPTHIKFLTEFHRIFFGATCISFSKKIGTA